MAIFWISSSIETMVDMWKKTVIAPREMSKPKR